MRYRFIKDNQSQFHIETMCRVLSVSRSAFYAWLKRAKSKREIANDELLEKARASGARVCEQGLNQYLNS